MINEEDAVNLARGGKTILLAGPTASGKSSLALRMAEASGLEIVNADALQVFSDWRILTARPSREDEVKSRHHLYGHVPGDHAYSTGEWLRDVAAILKRGPAIVVGGTGLNFTSLTDGLADIPPVPEAITQIARARLAEEGHIRMARELDSATREKIDLANPMRVFRAWTVHKATGRGLAAWHQDTPAPILQDAHHRLLIDAPPDWLTPRIEHRFEMMIDDGLIEEGRRNIDDFRADLPSSKAIGAGELIDFCKGQLSIDQLRDTIVVETRQYAKRQRTWFRNRFKSWTRIDVVS